MMNNLIKFSLFSILISITISCKNQQHQNISVEGKEIAIDSTLGSNKEIEKFIKPYRERVDAVLDSSLTYNPEVLSKSEKGMNTSIGNLMADIVMTQAAPVFKNRTGNTIDFALLNYGGIRSDLNKGAVTPRDGYTMMPFENQIVVVELTAEKTNQLLNYLETTKVAHPISGIKITMNQDYKITKATLNNLPVKGDRHYYVATSDYLQQGGDNMDFFKDPVQLYDIDYKLRSAIIDYFQKTDTIVSPQDDRFIIE